MENTNKQKLTMVIVNLDPKKTVIENDKLGRTSFYIKDKKEQLYYTWSSIESCKLYIESNLDRFHYLDYLNIINKDTKETEMYSVKDKLIKRVKTIKEIEDDIKKIKWDFRKQFQEELDKSNIERIEYKKNMDIFIKELTDKTLKDMEVKNTIDEIMDTRYVL